LDAGVDSLDSEKKALEPETFTLDSKIVIPGRYEITLESKALCPASKVSAFAS